jgi:hypothetical protein
VDRSDTQKVVISKKLQIKTIRRSVCRFENTRAWKTIKLPVSTCFYLFVAYYAYSKTPVVIMKLNGEAAEADGHIAGGRINVIIRVVQTFKFGAYS